MTNPTATKRELANELLTRLFAHRNRVAIAEAKAAGAEIGVSYRTLQRARLDLGLLAIHNGPHGAFWQRG